MDPDTSLQLLEQTKKKVFVPLDKIDFETGILLINLKVKKQLNNADMESLFFKTLGTNIYSAQYPPKEKQTSPDTVFFKGSENNSSEKWYGEIKTNTGIVQLKFFKETQIVDKWTATWDVSSVEIKNDRQRVASIPLKNNTPDWTNVKWTGTVGGKTWTASAEDKQKLREILPQLPKTDASLSQSKRLNIV